MKVLEIPNPVLDQRETELLQSITDKYEEFISPGKLTKAIDRVQDKFLKIAPGKLKKIVTDAMDVATEWEMIHKTIEHAGKGFIELQKHASRFTLTKPSTLRLLREKSPHLNKFEHICSLRSYNVESVATKRDYLDLFAALVEGAATGFPGFIGVPFNIALSFFLYFRAAQSMALYYGYDVEEDPNELEFAASVTLMSLSSNKETGAETLAGMIGKMMFAANMTALKTSLKSLTYTQMAKKGGSELLYVQIRALANKAAEKALKDAGREGLEAGIFKNLLEQVGKRLPKEAGAKSIPILGAVIGGTADTYYMSRVLKGSNLIYHKRFLFEKEHRINCLIEA